MKTSNKRVMDEINITPLTDIFLVLLIIMMVVAPLLNYRGLPLATLSGGDTQGGDKANPMEIVVNAQGSYSVDGQPVRREAIRETISKTIASNPDGVKVLVDPDADLTSLTFLLNAAHAANSGKIAVEERSASEEKNTKPTPKATEPKKTTPAKKR